MRSLTHNKTILNSTSVLLWLTFNNHVTTKLFNLNFHPLQVVSRWRDPYLQVSENYSDWQNGGHQFGNPADWCHVFSLACSKAGIWCTKKMKTDHNRNRRVKRYKLFLQGETGINQHIWSFYWHRLPWCAMPIGLVPVAEDQPFPGDDTEFNEESSSGDTTTPPGGFTPTGDLFPVETTTPHGEFTLFIW